MSLKDRPKRKRPLFSWKYFLYDFVKITAAVPAFVWIKPRKTYASDAARQKVKNGAIIISNHTGITDPVKLHFAFWYRRFYILAFKELFENKLRNFFFRKMLCLPVDRDNFNMSTFNTVQDVTGKGYPVGIFPEGKIVREEGNVGAFKGGAVMMALRCNVPIVPVYCAPYGGFFSITDIIVGEPINVRELCGAIPDIDKIESVSRLIREKELELVEIYRNRRGKHDE